MDNNITKFLAIGLYNMPGYAEIPEIFRCYIEGLENLAENPINEKVYSQEHDVEFLYIGIEDDNLAHIIRRLYNKYSYGIVIFHMHTKKPLNTHKQSVLKSAESHILEWVSINRGNLC